MPSIEILIHHFRVEVITYQPLSRMFSTETPLVLTLSVTFRHSFGDLRNATSEKLRVCSSLHPTSVRMAPSPAPRYRTRTREDDLRGRAMTRFVVNGHAREFHQR